MCTDKMEALFNIGALLRQKLTKTVAYTVSYYRRFLWFVDAYLFHDELENCTNTSGACIPFEIHVRKE